MTDAYFIRSLLATWTCIAACLTALFVLCLYAPWAALLVAAAVTAFLGWAYGWFARKPAHAALAAKEAQGKASPRMDTERLG